MDLPARRPFHHDEFPLDDLVARKGSTTISVCLPAQGRGSHDRWDRRRHPPTPGRGPPARRRDHRRRRPLDRRHRGRGHGGRRPGRLDRGALRRPGAGHGQGRGAVEGPGRVHRRPRRLVRRRHHRLRHPLHRRPPRPVARRADGAVRQGLLRPPRHAMPGTGGRTTELVARPVISLLFPSLTRHRPAAVGRVRGAPRTRARGACRSCRATASTSACSSTSRSVAAAAAIAQVDLGSRHHRNRTLDELSPQALVDHADGLRPRRLAGQPPGHPACGPASRPSVAHVERPPLAELRAAVAPAPDRRHAALRRWRSGRRTPYAFASACERRSGVDGGWRSAHGCAARAGGQPEQQVLRGRRPATNCTPTGSPSARPVQRQADRGLPGEVELGRVRCSSVDPLPAELAAVGGTAELGGGPPSVGVTSRS